jgi:superfamily II DNA or RNA helicase
MEVAEYRPGTLVTARGREWVVLPSQMPATMRLRPLSGSEADVISLVPELERVAVKASTFAPPQVDAIDNQDGARLLADALRLAMRRGAGPFRSAAQLGVEPRAYQLVPLLMALKLDVKRMLIADDVGIGKTIEAGMILREMFDRGQIDRFAIICPPHLVAQWREELTTKFDLDAVEVTASNARSLERGLPASQSLFEAYPYTIVSLDYIKADSRRDEFARACPGMVIVDEAHSCVGGDKGKSKHQRYELLQRLATDQERHMLFLTATPHSGDEDAYNRLLGLIHPDFALGPEGGDRNARERYAYRLQQHFVQRRRIDIEEEEWQIGKTFPKHLDVERPFILTGDWGKFQEDVLDYCVGLTQKAGDNSQKRRLAFWSTLALMRCIGSSPSAAHQALTNRLAGMGEEAELHSAVFDEEDGLLSDNDVEPGTGIADDERQELERLIDAAAQLAGKFEQDPKYKKLVGSLIELIDEQGASPIVFCRYIATAKAVGEALAKQFKGHRVEVITGELTQDDRRARIAALDPDQKRILVATDCLSEGINLQTLFDAVIHYDLSWNPTRHQQREGRVNRFGQPSPSVWTVMMYGENSMIDGAVLEVITRKADAIRKATGVTVPIPEDSTSVSAALMQAMLLRSQGPRAQGVLDLFGSSEGVERQWRDAEENARKSRARYAQGTMKPAEVIPEWRAMRTLHGGPDEVERFTRRALQRVGQNVVRTATPTIVFDQLPLAMAERLRSRGLTGSRRISFRDDAAPGVMHVGRVHPLVETLAESLAEGALDPKAVKEGRALGRCGAWMSKDVTQMTTILLMRLRFTMTTSRRANRTLLAEEATGLVFQGNETTPIASGHEALALLEAEAASNLEEGAIRRRLEQALHRLDAYQPAITDFAHERAKALSDDHERLTIAAKGGANTQVKAAIPADVIGLYVLIPEVA